MEMDAISGLLQELSVHMPQPEAMGAQAQEAK
jgi:hypothetical protein